MNLDTFLAENLSKFGPMFDPPLTPTNCVSMDLSSSSQEFTGLTETALDLAILNKLESTGAIAGVGGYLENRSLYKDTDLFQGDAERSIHVGVDVFMPAGTVIYSPLAGQVQFYI